MSDIVIDRSGKFVCPHCHIDGHLYYREYPGEVTISWPLEGFDDAQEVDFLDQLREYNCSNCGHHWWQEALTEATGAHP